MKKLIGRLKCYFGIHDWEDTNSREAWIKQSKCKKCGLIHERDLLLHKSIYYHE